VRNVLRCIDISVAGLLTCCSHDVICLTRDYYYYADIIASLCIDAAVYSVKRQSVLFLYNV